MKIPVWLLNDKLIKAATAKLFISAQINYYHEVSGKSAKGFGKLRRQIWCCGVLRGAWWMPGKGNNLISLLKSAQRCWRPGIDINLILKSQGGEGKFQRCLHQAPEGIQWITGKMQPPRINHLVTHPRLRPQRFWFCYWCCNLRIVIKETQEMQKIKWHLGLEHKLKPAGVGKWVLSLPHTGFHPLRKHQSDLRLHNILPPLFPGIKPKSNCSHQSFVVWMGEHRSLIL